MATWYTDLAQDRQPEALKYLLRGTLQHEVLQQLRSLEARPDWLDDYAAVRQMLDDLKEERWRSQALLGALFPDRFQNPPGPPPPPDSFFQQLEAWWDLESIRRDVIERYEENAWPDWLRRDGLGAGLQSGSREHWLGLLVLGACRSLGRTKPGQHRSFLEFAHGQGWWDVFKNSEDSAWMNILRTWQDPAAGSLPYLPWMSLFPIIYQLSRYLETYRRLLTSAALRRVDWSGVRNILAPRVDEALTGAGQSFDAPPAPLNIGLHWVLRELVRLSVLNGNHLFPDCWVPSEQVLQFLQSLGRKPLDGRAENTVKARAISTFLKRKLRTTPHLHRAFDIPLRHIDSCAACRREFGLN
jgi:hypothetical protein